MRRCQLWMLVKGSFTCSWPTVQKAQARGWKLARTWYHVFTLVPVKFLMGGRSDRWFRWLNSSAIQSQRQYGLHETRELFLFLKFICEWKIAYVCVAGGHGSKYAGKSLSLWPAMAGNWCQLSRMVTLFSPHGTFSLLSLCIKVAMFGVKDSYFSLE